MAWLEYWHKINETDERERAFHSSPGTLFWSQSVPTGAWLKCNYCASVVPFVRVHGWVKPISFRGCLWRPCWEKNRFPFINAGGHFFFLLLALFALVSYYNQDLFVKLMYALHFMCLHCSKHKVKSTAWRQSSPALTTLHHKRVTWYSYPSPQSLILDQCVVKGYSSAFLLHVPDNTMSGVFRAARDLCFFFFATEHSTALHARVLCFVRMCHWYIPGCHIHRCK